MKVKDFLEWFTDFDPESELKIELLEQIYNDNLGLCEEIYTPLEVAENKEDLEPYLVGHEDTRRIVKR